MIEFGCVRTVGQCVYVFGVPSRAYKVGIARDPEARLRTLQTGCPEPIEFLGASTLCHVGADPVAMERLVHEYLKNYRVQGEWFLVSFDHLIAVWQLAYIETRGLWLRDDPVCEVCDLEYDIDRGHLVPVCDCAYRARKKAERD